MNLDTYLKSGLYLPAPLRDFHDAKEVFKTMHASIDPNNESIKPVNWMAGQCYVIDIFLWWMAKRGWTLQRSRAAVEFDDLGADVKVYRDEQTEALKGFMEERRAAKAAREEPPNT